MTHMCVKSDTLAGDRAAKGLLCLPVKSQELVHLGIGIRSDWSARLLEPLPTSGVVSCKSSAGSECHWEGFPRPVVDHDCNVRILDSGTTQYVAGWRFSFVSLKGQMVKLAVACGADWKRCSFGRANGSRLERVRVANNVFNPKREVTSIFDAERGRKWLAWLLCF